MILSLVFQGVEDFQPFSFFKLVLFIIGPFHFHVYFKVSLFNIFKTDFDCDGIEFINEFVRNESYQF